MYGALRELDHFIDICKPRSQSGSQVIEPWPSRRTPSGVRISLAFIGLSHHPRAQEERATALTYVNPQTVSATTGKQRSTCGSSFYARHGSMTLPEAAI